jgi:hypothetical protein
MACEEVLARKRLGKGRKSASLRISTILLLVWRASLAAESWRCSLRTSLDQLFPLPLRQVMASEAGARSTARTSAAGRVVLQRATSEELKLSTPTLLMLLPPDEGDVDERIIRATPSHSTSHLLSAA